MHSEKGIVDWAKLLDNRGQVDRFILDFEKEVSRGGGGGGGSGTGSASSTGSRAIHMRTVSGSGSTL